MTDWHKITIFFSSGANIHVCLDYKIDLEKLKKESHLTIAVSQSAWVNLDKVDYILQEKATEEEVIKEQGVKK